ARSPLGEPVGRHVVQAEHPGVRPRRSHRREPARFGGASPGDGAPRPIRGPAQPATRGAEPLLVPTHLSRARVGPARLRAAARRDRFGVGRARARLARLRRHGHATPTAAPAADRHARRPFGRAWYLAVNPDVAEAGLDPVEHYVSAGWREGRDPHPLFDTDWY